MSGPIPIQLEAALLRSTLPELTLREGMTLAARVLERSGQHGVLSLAGRQIAAELPPGLAAGAEVRLRVQEAGPERIVLRVVEQPAAQAATAPPYVAVPLPDGTQARLAVQPDPEHESGGGRAGTPQAVTVTWQSAALGTLAMRLMIQPGALHAVVEAGPRGIEAVRGGVEALRQELAQATNRPADVKVIERAEPTDFYV